ncbi:hypothetical protein KI387_013443, partial [Taxus chinensis]
SSSFKVSFKLPIPTSNMNGYRKALLVTKDTQTYGVVPHDSVCLVILSIPESL